MTELDTTVKTLQSKVDSYDAALTRAIQANAPVEQIRDAYHELIEAKEALLFAGSAGQW